MSPSAAPSALVFRSVLADPTPLTSPRSYRTSASSRVDSSESRKTAPVGLPTASPFKPVSNISGATAPPVTSAPPKPCSPPLPPCMPSTTARKASAKSPSAFTTTPDAWPVDCDPSAYLSPMPTFLTPSAFKATHPLWKGPPPAHVLLT